MREPYISELKTRLRDAANNQARIEPMTISLYSEALSRIEGLEGCVQQALAIVLRYGGIDGGHHKAWVIDQAVRALAGDGYAAWVTAAKDGEDGPDTYEWDEGVPP